MFKFMVKSLKWLGIACAIGVLIRVGEVLIIKHNENNVEETQQVAEIINDNIVAESVSDNKQTIEDIEVSTKNETTKKEEKVEEKKEQKQVVSKVNKDTKTEQKEEIKEETKKEPVVDKQETTEIKEENKVEQVVETQKEEKTIVKQEEIKQEEIKQEVKAEEYKVNNQIISKIKEIIKNNETEDMKMYGYNIVVDSSIPDKTNEFTFSEQRVINKLTLKFGTIRIYARDYYNNGVYISTQCFII